MPLRASGSKGVPQPRQNLPLSLLGLPHSGQRFLLVTLGLPALDLGGVVEMVAPQEPQNIALSGTGLPHLGQSFMKRPLFLSKSPYIILYLYNCVNVLIGNIILDPDVLPVTNVEFVLGNRVRQSGDDDEFLADLYKELAAALTDQIVMSGPGFPMGNGTQSAPRR